MEKQCNVLIIEDEDCIRDSLKLVLEYDGYQVQGAANGKEALEILPHLPKPCLILMDLMMPEMNGWELSEVLASDEKLATIPVVILSAFWDRAQGVKCKEILKKPIDLDDLLPIVERYCPKTALAG